MVVMMAFFSDIMAIPILRFQHIGNSSPINLTKESKMPCRAAIYIRTSSEIQGERSSPVVQESDCRHPAQEKGLQVVRVYRDKETFDAKIAPVRAGLSKWNWMV